MTNKDFGIIAFSAMLAAIGVLLAFSPRAIPRMTNAYYTLIRMKSRLEEDDYDKPGVRVAGGFFFAVALYVLINHWLFK